MNNLNDDRLQASAVRFANELSKFPPEVAVVVGLVFPHLPNGCSWAFAGDTDPEFNGYVDLINANPNMCAFKIKGGYLVNINMDYLLSVLRKTAGGFVTSKDLQKASEHRQESIIKLEKFLKKGGSGKIGIYNLNDSPRITVKGVGFPAFCVTITDLIGVCVKNGRMLNLGGQHRSPGDVSKRLPQVIERLEIAPSGNALFISIA